MGYNGNRIKLMRQANCLSLQQLADILCDHYVPISRAALSNYETGRRVPNVSALQTLAVELGTVPAFFMKEDWDGFQLELSRPLDIVPLRQQELYSFIQVELERNLEIDRALGKKSSWKKPEKRIFEADGEAVEAYIEEIREEWGLGSYPVSSVCGILEKLGWYLISSTEQFRYFDISGYESSTQSPFILYHPNYFIDEFRLSLLTEMGYLYVEGRDEEETEKIARHFARGLLFSRQQAVYELGENRTKIAKKELSMVKQKYGISKRNIMLRLFELGIIGRDCYDSFDTHLRQHSFLKREKAIMDLQYFFEVPITYEMKVLRADAEGTLPDEQAEYFMAIQDK